MKSETERSCRMKFVGRQWPCEGRTFLIPFWSRFSVLFLKNRSFSMQWALSLLFAFVFLSGPVCAQSKTPIDTNRNYGKAYCEKEFQCPNAIQEAPNLINYYRAIIAEGNSCSGSFLGTSAPNGLFEDTFPDGEGCLVSKPPASQNGGLALVPYCCLKPSTKTPNKCSLVCTLQGMR